MAELVDWLHHESITRASYIRQDHHLQHGSLEPHITNADRIRAMSDEELAERMSCFECVGCPLCHEDCVGKSCKDAILEWLKKEVDDD